jgi:hypothetical protein
MDKPIDLDDELELKKEGYQEDHLFLRNAIKQMKLHKSKELEIDYEKKDKMRTHSMSRGESNHFVDNINENGIFAKGTTTTDDKYYQILRESFDKVHPLIYLDHEQRKTIMNSIVISKFEQKTLLYSGMEDDFDPGDWACFILLEGEIHIFNNKHIFKDLINNVTFFGYDGPIFQRRLNTVLVEENSVIGIIRQKEFLSMLKPFSKFATFISRNIRYKDKVLDDLQSFINYVLSSIDKGPIDMNHLLSLYQKMRSCLHPKCHSDELDVHAWTYALNRLPESVIETYTFVLINKPPRLLSLSDELAQSLVPRVNTNARNRDIYRYIQGKNLIIVREMETDVLDFISNMCIHILESTKLRKYICSPITVNKIHQARQDFEKTLDVIRNTTGLHINEDETDILRKVFGNNFAEKLIHLCLNYQDVSIKICKETLTDKDPVENWIQNLWNVTRELLSVNSSVDEIDDLIVDVIQGSKKTLLASISPHPYMIKDEIYKWAEENNIVLKTKTFLNENDRFIAYSFYYYLAFPEMAKEKERLEQEHGIKSIDKTFGTGVKILVVNANKLDPKYIDPNINLSFVSKNHIIIHIGYTFGAQSHHIIKPLLMLFGSKIRSMNIIGKAGGLQGDRTDIVVADKVFLDKNHDVAEVNFGQMDFDELRIMTKSNIHVGPMLTVAGTILQNNDLLNFYKHVMGCVGLEMEGYFFAREIENSIKHNLLSKDFKTRMFYYVSDIPLDPKQTLSKEGQNVSWDEGICSMNAIQRIILKYILS